MWFHVPRWFVETELQVNEVLASNLIVTICHPILN